MKEHDYEPKSNNPITSNLEASDTRCYNCGHSTNLEGELDGCMCKCHNE